MKVNPAVDLDIHGFSGSGITEYESGMTNCVLHKKGEQYKVTQRPSIDITEDSTSIGLNDRARGIYYWEQNTKLYIVHDNDVYPANQSATALGQITAGTERVTMLETIGTPRMVILDAENDEGWVVSTAESLTQISTAGAGTYDHFPTEICHGGTILDGYLFVMDEDGIIYNSDVDDPTTFNALSFLEAERDNDKGVYLGKHHDHVVAFGTRTIEFFYDAGNATGSPLNRRTDVSYNIGCADGLGVWENGDIIYFIGSNSSGQLQVYKLENFQVTPISNDSMNSYITQGLTQSGLNVVMNGLSAMGKDTLLMTVYTLVGSPTAITPKITISFDTASGLWGFWKTSLNSHTTFPVMAWTKRTGGQSATLRARTGEGILYNGDVIAINDKLIPVDTSLASDGVYSDGVYDDDIYSTGASDVGTNISIVIRTGLQDGGTSAYKFQNRLTLNLESTDSTQTVTIKESDELADNFSTGNEIDISQMRKEIHQGGRFVKRNYQLEYNGSEQIFVEYLDVDVSVGL